MVDFASREQRAPPSSKAKGVTWSERELDFAVSGYPQVNVVGLAWRCHTISKRGRGQARSILTYSFQDNPQVKLLGRRRALPVPVGCWAVS